MCFALSRAQQERIFGKRSDSVDVGGLNSDQICLLLYDCGLLSLAKISGLRFFHSTALTPSVQFRKHHVQFENTMCTLPN